MLVTNNKSSTQCEVDSPEGHSKSRVRVPRGNIFIFMLRVRERRGRVCWRGERSRAFNIIVHYVASPRTRRETKREAEEGRT